MKNLLKSLIVWLMLLAVPLQGYAAAAMPCCMPAPATAAAAAQGHDHQAMLAGVHARHAHAAAAALAGSAHDLAGHAPAGHHAGCAVCCLGAAMAAPQVPRVQVASQRAAAVRSDSGAVQSVDLALPERPPQASPA